MTSRIMCSNVTHSHVILFAQTLFWFDFFQVQPPSSTSSTSITRAPPSKDVGQVRKHFSTPLKQHGRWPRLPLPSPSTLLCHSMSSVENASRSAPSPLSAMTLDVEHQGHPSLPSPSHPLLCHVTMSSVEDISPGLPLPFSLPCHLTLSVENASPACHHPFTLCFAMSLDVER